MQSKPIIVLTLLLLMVLPCFVNLAGVSSDAPTLEWSKTFGYAGAYALAQTDDGNLLVAVQSAPDYQYVGHLGFHYKNLTGELIKLDLTGNVLWTKDLPCLPVSMISSGDDEFIIAGEVHNFFATTQTDVSAYPITQSFASLAKVDANGNIAWNHTYMLQGQPVPNPASPVSLGVSFGATVNFLIQTTDGGYLFGGKITQPATIGTPEVAQSQAWLIKTDATGKVVWTKMFNSSSTIYAAAQTSDGGFLLEGNIDNFNLIKTDTSGNILWSKQEQSKNSSQNYIEYTSIAKAPDDEYLLAGYNYYVNGSVTVTAGITKLDKTFNQQWTKNYDIDWAYGFSYQYSINSSYYFTSQNKVLKTDIEGNVDWMGSYNGSINALCAVDGGLALAGQVESNPGSSIKTTYIFVQKIGATTPPVSSGPTSPIPEPDLRVPVSIGIAAAITLIAVAIYVKRRKR